MQSPYITFTNNAYRIANTRVSLDSVVLLFREGFSAESIVESYPSLSLEQTYGALAFYLGNQPQIDAYLLEGQRQAKALHADSLAANAEFLAKLQRAKNASNVPG